MNICIYSGHDGTQGTLDKIMNKNSLLLNVHVVHEHFLFLLFYQNIYHVAKAHITVCTFRCSVKL